MAVLAILVSKVLPKTNGHQGHYRLLQGDIAVQARVGAKTELRALDGPLCGLLKVCAVRLPQGSHSDALGNETRSIPNDPAHDL